MSLCGGTGLDLHKNKKSAKNITNLAKSEMDLKHHSPTTRAKWIPSRNLYGPSLIMNKINLTKINFLFFHYEVLLKRLYFAKILLFEAPKVSIVTKIKL